MCMRCVICAEIQILTIYRYSAIKGLETNLASSRPRGALGHSTYGGVHPILFGKKFLALFDIFWSRDIDSVI